MNEPAYRTAENNYWKHYGVIPQERWLALPAFGTKVRVLEVGEGTPVLFVHGGPNAGTTFAPLASHLKDFRCIVLDRPGCGLSPPISYSETPHNETLPKVLSACLDALGLEKVSVVGSSFGGTCAFWLALRHPESVQRIVLMGCPPFIGGAKMPVFLRLLATPGIGALLCRLPANRSGTMAFLDAMGQQNAKRAGLIPEEFVDWWISLGRDTDTMINDRELVRRGLTFRGMRPELIIPDDQLQRLPHPTYVYWGEDDPVADVEYARELFSSMPKGRIDFIPNSGHLPWLDNPADAAGRACVSPFLTPSPSNRLRPA